MADSEKSLNTEVKTSKTSVEEAIYISENDSLCEGQDFKREPEKAERERKVRNIPAGIVKAEKAEDKKRKIKVWTPAEDDMLFKLFQDYGTKWEEVAKRIPVRIIKFFFLSICFRIIFP